MIEFEDLDSRQRAYVIVRRAGEGVGLAVFLENDGDMEVFAPPEVARKIARALDEMADAE